MEVSINGKKSVFVSQFDPHKKSNNGWEKQNQDHFKFIFLNGTKVFVKRFEGEKKIIPGYQYLMKTLNKRIPNLPMIYDLVSTTEDGKIVCYLFQEALEGNTMQEFIQKGILNFSPIKFAKHLYLALESITKNGFWFSDFVERNIFITYGGDYYLIDLDSVVPLSVMPVSEDPLLSKINNNYKIAVFNYWYKDTFKYPYQFIKKNLRGDTINFLELFILVAQFKYYLDDNCRNNFNDEKARKAIPQYLLNKNEKLTYAVFKSCFENTSNHQQILSWPLFESFIKTVLFENDNLIKIDFQNRKVINGINNTIVIKKSTSTFTTSQGNDAKAKEISNLITAIKNNLDKNQLNAANKNIQHLVSVDPKNINIKSLNNILFEKEQEQREELKKKKIEDAKNRLLSDNVIPYKCPSCSYPVKPEEESNFSTIMAYSSAAITVFSLWEIIGLWSLGGIIGGPVIWFIISEMLPESWTKEKLKCDNCKKDYYSASHKF